MVGIIMPGRGSFLPLLTTGFTLRFMRVGGLLFGITRPEPGTTGTQHRVLG